MIQRVAHSAHHHAPRLPTEGAELVCSLGLFAFSLLVLRVIAVFTDTQLFQGTGHCNSLSFLPRLNYLEAFFCCLLSEKNSKHRLIGKEGHCQPSSDLTLGGTGHNDHH